MYQSIRQLARSSGISTLYWSLRKMQISERWYEYRIRSPKMIRSHIQRCHESGKQIWLQIGSGGHTLPGWLNTDYDRHLDCAFLDATKLWPFADSELSLIQAEHVIANLTKEGGVAFLRESYRCLQPGGILRLSTPNLTMLSRLLISDGTKDVKTGLLQRHQRLYRPGEDITFCDLVNDIHYLWGHRYLYTEEELFAQLRAAGFTQIEHSSFGQSRDRRLMGIDQHQAGPEMAYIDLIVEAVR